MILERINTLTKLTAGTKFQFHSSDNVGTIKSYSPANVEYSFASNPEQTYNMSAKHFDKLLAIIIGD